MYYSNGIIYIDDAIKYEYIKLEGIKITEIRIYDMKVGYLQNNNLYHTIRMDLENSTKYN